MQPRIIVILLILLGLFGILIFFFLNPPAPPPPPLADWGDAPDPDPSMDTGYYAPFPSAANPLVLVYGNAGIAAQFPCDEVGVQGPYLLDVDDVWIGPMAVPPFFAFPGIGLVPPAGPAGGDVPSLEAGVYDPADPDGPSNLTALPPSAVVTKADCDRENATHTPSVPAGLSGTICNPVPPYSIGMNGVLMIVVGNPPLAVFLTRIWFAAGAQVEEGVYWNVLFDTDQSGDWSSSPARREWVAQDEFVLFAGVSSRLVATPAFEWGSSGSPFGRLLFPVWARSMVSTESVADAVAPPAGDWDGRGPASGFERGEVEDYFVEWTPIGQMLGAGGGGGGGGGGAGGDGGGEGLAERLCAFGGPDRVAAGSETAFPSTGAEPAGIAVVALASGSGAAHAAADLPLDGTQVPVSSDAVLSVSARWTDGAVVLSVEAAPSGAVLLLLASRGGEEELGTGRVPVLGGKRVVVE